MKKFFAILAAGLICFGAFAQESSILEDWEEQMESQMDDIISQFSFLNFTYNHNLAAPDGYNPSGWGFEFSTLHFGFSPWKNGRFSLGLLDLALDFSYLRPQYQFVVIDGQIEARGGGLVPEGNQSKATFGGVLFPLGYIQRFGQSGWSAAVFASPGVGFASYNNTYVQSNIRHKDDLRINRQGSYFRLDLKTMIWYDNFGIVARYSFPRGFQGAGVVSAGISFRI